MINMSVLIGLTMNVAIDLMLFSYTRPVLQLVKLATRLVRSNVSCVHVMNTFTFFRTLSLALSTSLHDTGGTVCPVVIAIMIGVLGVVNGCSLVFNHFNFPRLNIRNTTVSATFDQNISVVVLFIVLFHGRVRHFPPTCFHPFP